MKIETSHPSPNFGSRHGRALNLLVLHADGSRSIDSTLDWCASRASKVSYHTVVGRSGRLFGLVSTDHSAWHAGISEYPGSTVTGPKGPCVNAHSVGLCLSNAQDGKEPFADAQLAAAALYAASLLAAFPLITLDRIVTHAAVARPVGRKHDPAPAGPFDLADFVARVRSIR